ncbi:MAG: tetratricopeptide repeat protein [Nitrosospira sp.]|nr:tetratricopeptide repeat protein [Nitrosospira sp.]
MATYDLEEQEKIDGLKSWWEMYGTVVIVVVATLVASVVGTQVWNRYQKQQVEQAAELYASLQQIDESDDPKKISAAAHLLIEGFPRSGYAPRAAMASARARLEAGDKQAARTRLQWAMDHTKENELKDLVQLRLAGLLLDEKKYDEALKLVESKHSESFSSLYADRKGDILTASGKVPEARVAYQLALDRINAESAYHNIIQMKLDALAETK